nr:hypothetical protein CFP56_21643 [Quercus suber]
MFDCLHCTTRTIRAIARDTSHARINSRFQHPRLILTPQLGHRYYADLATAPSEPLRNGTNAIVHDTGRIQSDPAKAHYESAIRKELQWLQDPLKLAEHVHYTLRCNQSAKALDLVRRASRQMNCVVSWNHIVDWLMKQERPDEAIKVYNEMKKRAQFPDSYTYILLLRGLISKTPLSEKKYENARAKDYVNKAVHIYNSMGVATSRVKPTIMHTNALLRVCSFASDLDAFWGVAGQIPEQGSGAADHITYTTILDAIRHGAISSLPEDYSDEEISKCRLDAIDQALRIWPEIIAKWRNGQVKIDDELVAAMGRVLLLSPRIKEWDTVLDLVQQTMNIERLIPKLGSPDRQTAHVPQMSEDSMEELSSHTADTTSSELRLDRPIPSSRVFEPLRPVVSKSKASSDLPSFLYAKPGNSTLSVLVEACDKMRIPRTLNAYWERLTQESNVAPDASNYDALLSNLYLNRGSMRAASIIKEMVATGTLPNKFTLIKAMKVCRRDTKNRNMFDSATTIIKAMHSSLADADPGLCMHYLSLAQSTGDGAKIVLALNTLDDAKNNLSSYMNFGPAGGRKLSISADLFQKEVTLRLFELMVSTIDTLMHRALVPREDFNHYHARRKELTSFITRARDNLLHAQAKLPPTLVEKIRLQASGVGKHKASIPSSAAEDAVSPARRTRPLRESTSRHESDATEEVSTDQPKRQPRALNFRPRSSERRTGGHHDRETDLAHGGSRPQHRPREQIAAAPGFADSPADLGM